MSARHRRWCAAERARVHPGRGAAGSACLSTRAVHRREAAGWDVRSERPEQSVPQARRRQALAEDQPGAAGAPHPGRRARYERPAAGLQAVEPQEGAVVYRWTGSPDAQREPKAEAEGFRRPLPPLVPSPESTAPPQAPGVAAPRPEQPPVRALAQVLPASERPAPRRPEFRRRVHRSPEFPRPASRRPAPRRPEFRRRVHRSPDASPRRARLAPPQAMARMALRACPAPLPWPRPSSLVPSSPVPSSAPPAVRRGGCRAGRPCGARDQPAPPECSTNDS